MDRFTNHEHWSQWNDDPSDFNMVSWNTDVRGTMREPEIEHAILSNCQPEVVWWKRYSCVWRPAKLVSTAEMKQALDEWRRNVEYTFINPSCAQSKEVSSMIIPSCRADGEIVDGTTRYPNPANLIFMVAIRSENTTLERCESKTKTNLNRKKIKINKRGLALDEWQPGDDTAVSFSSIAKWICQCRDLSFASLPAHSPLQHHGAIAEYRPYTTPVCERRREK